MTANRHHSDDAVLERFKYKPELIRRLGFFGSFAVAFSAMSMTSGIFAGYGFVIKNCGPIAIWTWPLIALLQTLVAVILAELAGRIPISGYSYQWVSRLSGPALGWLSGWFGVFFMVFGAAAVNWALAPVVAQVLGIAAAPMHLLTLTLIFIGLEAFINVEGVKLTSKMNNAAVYTEIAGILGIALLVAAKGLFTNGPAVFHPSLLLSFTPGIHSGPFGALVLGSVMACWTFVAFEWAADLSEETVQAGKVVPKAMVSALLYGALIGMVFLIMVTLAIPNLGVIANSENPIPDILQSVLGRGLSVIFLWFVIVSMFSCATIAMTGASRLIYSMARDGVFVFSGYFRKVSAHKVPNGGVFFVLIISVFISLFVHSFDDLLSASAILPILVYLITIGSYAARYGTLPSVDTFNLRKWNLPLTIAALVWLVAEMGILVIPEEFRGGVKICGTIFLFGAAVYLLFVRRHILSGQAGIKDRY